MEFPKQAIKNFLNSMQKKHDRETVIDAMQEWLEDTTPIHAEISELKHEDIDVNMQEIISGE